MPKAARLVCWSLGWTLGLGCASPSPASKAPASSQAQDPDGPGRHPDARVARAVERLEQADFEVDVAGLTVETREFSGAVEDMLTQQGKQFPATYFDGFRCVAELLNGDALAQIDGKTFRKLAAHGIAEKLAAYYTPTRDAMVFVETEHGRLRDPGELVVHELVHVAQQRRGTIQERVDAATLDELKVWRSMVEGEAELASLLVRIKEQGSSLDAVDESLIDGGASRLISGEMSAEYTAGLLYMLRIYRQGGWDQVSQAFASPPQTTEQLLHPDKHDLPPPTPVVLDLSDSVLAGLTPLHEDEIGELGLQSLLRVANMGNDDAVLGSAGWDGDRYRAFDDPDGRCTLVWRTRWDRELDAKQFKLVLDALANRSSRAIVEHRGRVVDVVMGELTLAKRILLELRRSPAPPAGTRVQADATARFEGAHLARSQAAAGIVDGRFVVTAAGTSVAIPDGWKIYDVRGVKALRAPIEDGFADNVSVFVFPAGGIASLDEFEKQVREQFQRLQNSTLVSLERRKLDGVEVLWTEAEGKSDPNTPRTHTVTVSTLRGDRTVVVVVATTAARWPERGKGLVRLLEGLRWIPIPTTP